MRRAVLAVLTITCLAATARADDRAACKAGDNRACARIGELKRNGALKADGTKDTGALVGACGTALDGAKASSDFRQVASACAQLFNPELQKAWGALGMVDGHQRELLLTDGYGEAYCPKLAKPVAGCKGKHVANVSAMNPAELRKALAALDAAALDQELGAEQAQPLAAKFDAAWPKLFGP